MAPLALAVSFVGILFFYVVCFPRIKRRQAEQRQRLEIVGRIKKRGRAQSEEEYRLLFPRACPICCCRVTRTVTTGHMQAVDPDWPGPDELVEDGEESICARCGHGARHELYTLDPPGFFYEVREGIRVSCSPYLTSEEAARFPDFDTGRRASALRRVRGIFQRG